MYDEIDRSRERETKARKHRRLATAKPAAHNAHGPPPRIGKEEAASKSKLFTKKRRRLTPINCAYLANEITSVICLYFGKHSIDAYRITVERNASGGCRPTYCK